MPSRAGKPIVYISSTFVDLVQHRAALKRALEKAQYDVQCMEKYPAFDERPLEKCLADVAAAEVFVLLLAHRYGHRPAAGNPDRKSITQLEYEEAGSHPSKERLVFSIDPDHPWLPKWCDDRGSEEGQALAAFRAELEQRHGRACFTDPDQLAKQVLEALSARMEPAASSTSRFYTLADLDTWVDKHHRALESAFWAIPSVQVRRLHVDLPVKLLVDGVARQRLLRPGDVACAVEGVSAHLLLITGTGGAGKTSLAFLLARWGLALNQAGEDGGRLAEHRMVPVLIDTALAEHETVLARVRQQLEQAIGASSGELEEGLVLELLRHKRLLVIVDHFSELAEAARERVLRSLPTALVVVTSRQDESRSLGGKASTRIEPLPIAIDRLQPFFRDYLELKQQLDNFSEDELEPSQKQLRRIVGSKPITPLLAQMFIDDVIAKKQEEGLLAASVPDLMLGYVQRIDAPISPRQRRREGLLISSALVERSLKCLALASLEQRQAGVPRYQPIDFPSSLAEQILIDLVALGRSPCATDQPTAQGLTQATPDLAAQGMALLGYLVEHRLLHHVGQSRTRLSFPLDPLADYLAAMEQLERLLAATALQDGEQVWRAFLDPLIARHQRHPLATSMAGFLLALRDCCIDRLERDGAAPIAPGVPDQLGRLGGLDPEEERRRLAEQRTRRWVYELAVPEEEDRAAALERIGAMLAPNGEAVKRAATRRLAGPPLARVVADAGRPMRERCDAAVLLGLMANRDGMGALRRVLEDDRQPVALRRAAAEALGLLGRGADLGEEDRRAIQMLLEGQLRHRPCQALVRSEDDWEPMDGELPLLQGAARGLQVMAAPDLPVLGAGPGHVVPMLTVVASRRGEKELTVGAEVVNQVAVWKLPLPGGEQVELVVVPGGEYRLGSPETEEGRNLYANQRDGCKGVNVEAERTVRLEAFAMARVPISQAQWAAAARLEPIRRDLKISPGSFKPERVWECYAEPGGLAVDSVSWWDCQEWLGRWNRWLAEHWAEQGGKGATPEMGLPSESQWEAACRAASEEQMPFHFGEILNPSWANFDGTYTYGAGRQGAFRQRPRVTGAFGLVNRWGLADLHGQLSEWCGDYWHPNPIGPGWPEDGHSWPEPDPALEGSAQQQYRLLRGGSWFVGPHFCRAAYRYGFHPGGVSSNVGVRPCCPLPPGFLSLPLNP